MKDRSTTTPKSKEQGKQWVGSGGTAPKQAKRQQLAGKVMTSVFWDYSGIFIALANPVREFRTVRVFSDRSLTGL